MADSEVKGARSGTLYARLPLGVYEALKAEAERRGQTLSRTTSDLLTGALMSQRVPEVMPTEVEAYLFGRRMEVPISPSAPETGPQRRLVPGRPMMASTTQRGHPMSDSTVYERIQNELAQLREDVNGYIQETASDVRGELTRRIDNLERDLESLRGDVRDLERRLDRDR
jgi:hypothetical protein